MGETPQLCLETQKQLCWTNKMDWTPDDVITTDKYLAAFPTYYAKTESLKRPIVWRGNYVTPPPTTVPYLITGHSDESVTDADALRYKDTVWFSVNAESQRIHGLPLGLTNNTLETEVHPIYGNVDILYKAANEPCDPTLCVYMNFSVETFPSERKYVYEKFVDKPWVTTGTFVPTLEGRAAYLRDIRNHSFVLCPRGNGVDTVRIWETLYLGRIPIVIDTIVHKDWHDLPILFIQSWDEVTEEFLHKKQEEFASKKWNLEKLKVGYWIDKMRASFPKPLVYYTVGYSSTYIDVTGLSLKTLRKSGYTGDVAVICDQSFLPRCKQILGDGILYMTLPDSKTPEQASMNKLRIFELPNIDAYDRVLFLDSDIVVHMNVYSLFQSISTVGKLYVYSETTKQEDHTNLMWSLQTYTPLDLAFFAETSVHVFNAGCFAFVRANEMKDHFLSIQYQIMQHTGKFFYEQSFMNVYFNRNGQTDRTLLTDKNYVFPKGTQAYPGYLVHFAGDPGSGQTKFQRMSRYIESYLKT